MSLPAAVNFILQQEGSELVQNPGLSRYGIDLSRHPELTAADIQNMTPTRAAIIYSGPQYAGAIHFEQLPPGIQLPMLDACVNQGPTAAIRCLQAALYVTVDGVLGPQTLTAAQDADAHTLLARFTAQRVLAYTRDSTFAQDGAGWINRAVLAALEA